MSPTPLARQAEAQATQLALELKALLKGSGQTALAASSALGRAPQYLTRVFSGRVALKMKDAFGILQSAGASPRDFFGRLYPSGEGAGAESRLHLDASQATAAQGGPGTAGAWVARTRAALRRAIVAAGTNQRALSRALGLPQDALGQALHGGTDLTAWHVFGVLIATKTPANEFFREVVAQPAEEQRRARLASTPSEVASQREGEATRYGDFVRLSPAGRVAWLSDHPESAAFFTCRSLIEQSESLRGTDAAAMIAAARAAVACAEAFPSPAALHALRVDLQAEAWGGLANALRVKGLLNEADRAWRRADTYLALGSGDPRLKARHLLLKGSLRVEQRRLRQAIELVEESRQLSISISDGLEETKTLLTLSRAYWLADRLEEAIAAAVNAAARAQGPQGAILKVSAFHNLALYLEEAGRPSVALAILERAEPLYEESAGPLLKLRKRWIEGRLLARLDRLEEAVSILDSVRQRFTDLGMVFDAALAALDLATFYAQLGKLHEVEALATEMYPVFVSRDIPREATAALLLFAEAARAHTATVASITEVAERLKKIQSRKG